MQVRPIWGRVSAALALAILGVTCVAGCGERSISRAVKDGRLAEVEQSLEQSVDVHSMDSRGATLLHIAAENGQTEIAALLLRRGADPDRMGELGVGPLHWAAGEGHLSMVSTLIDGGATFDLKDKHGQTPLWFAIADKETKVAQYFIERGADCQIVNSAGIPLLQVAAATGPDIIVEQLLKDGANVNERESYGMTTALHMAAMHNQASIASILINHGAEVGAVDKDGDTALDYASGRGNKEVRAVLSAALTDDTDGSP